MRYFGTSATIFSFVCSDRRIGSNGKLHGRRHGGLAVMAEAAVLICFATNHDEEDDECTRRLEVKERHCPGAPQCAHAQPCPPNLPKGVFFFQFPQRIGSDHRNLDV